MIFTDEMVLGESWGRSWLGANTLYNSKKSEEKMIGTSNWPGCHLNEGGTVSMKLSSMLSRKRSVLKGIMFPALAFTLYWLDISGAASSTVGWALISDNSFSLNVLFLPMFSLVITLVIEM